MSALDPAEPQPPSVVTRPAKTVLKERSSLREPQLRVLGYDLVFGDSLRVLFLGQSSQTQLRLEIKKIYDRHY